MQFFGEEFYGAVIVEGEVFVAGKITAINIAYPGRFNLVVISRLGMGTCIDSEYKQKKEKIVFDCFHGAKEAQSGLKNITLSGDF